ncbi:MAG: flagellar hook-length control protein FliK, partial [Anaerolineales bacterium]|nr:flagellar hook-length control protein FliK [Anaerolineales bacterium]
MVPTTVTILSEPVAVSTSGPKSTWEARDGPPFVEIFNHEVRKETPDKTTRVPELNRPHSQDKIPVNERLAVETPAMSPKGNDQEPTAEQPPVDEQQQAVTVDAQAAVIQTLVVGLLIPAVVQAPATPQQVGQDGQTEAAGNTLSTAPNAEGQGLAASFQAVADHLMAGGQEKAEQNRTPVVKIDLQPNKPEAELNAQISPKFSQPLATIEPHVENQAEAMKDQAAVVGRPLMNDQAASGVQPLMKDQAVVVERLLMKDPVASVGQPLMKDQAVVVERLLMKDSAASVGQPLMKDLDVVVERLLMKDSAASVGQPLMKDPTASVGQPLMKDQAVVVERLLMKDQAASGVQPLMKDPAASVGQPIMKDQAAVVGQPLITGDPQKAELRPVTPLQEDASKGVVEKAGAAVEQVATDRATSQSSVIPSTLKQVTEPRVTLHNLHLERDLADGVEQPVTVKAEQSVTVKADQPDIAPATLAGQQANRTVNAHEPAASVQKSISTKDGAEQAAQPPVNKVVAGVELADLGKAMGAPPEITNSEPARLAEARNLHLTQQIARQVEDMANSGLKTLRMQLYPEALGKLELQLTSQGGSLKVVILADLAATQQTLERHALDLQQALQQTGVNLTGLTIGQRGAGDQPNGEQRY